ncbi:MAG: hypothetical protein KGL39_56395, partial [Patescibacteria group bacterium]|nr:hypothetical protein [Patescibacteria group bacterium]
VGKGQGYSRPVANLGAFLAIEIIAVFFGQIAAANLVWLIPLDLFLSGLACLLPPFTLLSILGTLFAELCCMDLYVRGTRDKL